MPVFCLRSILKLPFAGKPGAGELGYSLGRKMLLLYERFSIQKKYFMVISTESLPYVDTIIIITPQFNDCL